MGPIPGVSWNDVGELAAGFGRAVAFFTLAWFLGEAFAGGTRPIDRIRVYLIALALPIVLVGVYGDLLGLPAEAYNVATWSWLIGTAAVRVGVAVLAARAAKGIGGLSGGVPNVLLQARAPNVLARDLRSGLEVEPSTVPDGWVQPARPRWRFPVVLLLSAVVVLPKAVVVLATQTACEGVEVILASASPQTADHPPDGWMPTEIPQGYSAVGGFRTLEDVAQSRVDPDASRTELQRDGLVDAYELKVYSANDEFTVDAQHFATMAGAVAFNVYANRFACQFANEAFAGRMGEVGLQIRYEGGGVAEQYSWVSGASRIIVWVRQETVDHSHLEWARSFVPRR